MLLSSKLQGVDKDISFYYADVDEFFTCDTAPAFIKESFSIYINKSRLRSNNIDINSIDFTNFLVAVNHGLKNVIQRVIRDEFLQMV